MKKTLITVALLSLGVYGVLGQGAINFNTRALNLNPAAVNAPIYGPESDVTRQIHGNHATNGGTPGTIYSGVLLTGTGFTAQLWAAPAAGGVLAPLSTTVMRPAGSLAGYIVPPAAAPTVANAAGGSQVNFDFRVWDNRGGTITTWAQVMADPTILRGSSGTFTTAVAEPPNTPPNLVGLTSFNVFSPVPEPSVIALGALGLGALLLRRRKA
jgi:hypothetical protein